MMKIKGIPYATLSLPYATHLMESYPFVSGPDDLTLNCIAANVGPNHYVDDQDYGNHPPVEFVAIDIRSKPFIADQHSHSLFQRMVAVEIIIDLGLLIVFLFAWERGH
jgi:hypothetical protein